MRWRGRGVALASVGRKFVKKLSHPDSIARIQKRNWAITEETERLDNEDGVDVEEEEEVQRKNGGRGFKKYLLHRRLETFKSDRWDDRPHTLVFRVSSISCLPVCPCLYLPR